MQNGEVERDYAWREPGIAFLTTDFMNSVTLTHPAPNLFRFEPDYAQTVRGARRLCLSRARLATRRDDRRE